jgi:transposase
MEGKVTLNKKEQKRLMVLNQVDRGDMAGKQGAEVLGLSLRHTMRVLAAYRKEGAAGLAHGNRGRKPKHALSDELRSKVLELAKSRYDGCNHQHFTELLGEREAIFLSRSSVRRILLGSGIRSPRKRRPPKHRSRRERYPQEGMLLQIDGSPHDWLEGRGPELSLVGAIDDATGRVPHALFRTEEDTMGYVRLLLEIVRHYGIPLAIYHDRHSIFEVSADKLPSLEEQLAGKRPLTQLGRVLQELGITSISALSPQAKGRIERLWGTFQDRLVSELRLAGVSTLEEANHFLKGFLNRYNARFAVPPAQAGLAYRNIEGLDIDTIFCLKHKRVVGADNVVRFNGHRLQVLPSMERLSYARCSVEVHQQLDGCLRIYYQGHYLNTSPAPAEATKMRELVGVTADSDTRIPRQVTKPPKDHPWRQWVYH